MAIVSCKLLFSIYYYILSFSLLLLVSQAKPLPIFLYKFFTQPIAHIKPTSTSFPQSLYQHRNQLRFLQWELLEF
ncbi:hypothetical protein P8452_05056 [Trifolium repens]|nr:hypothetical protein P8452_05056 [Trifolium repens]